MMQSRRWSAVEAVTNVLVGFWLAVATQFVVFPWFDLEPSIQSNLAIGGIFTAVSLARSYALRRAFNRIRA